MKDQNTILFRNAIQPARHGQSQTQTEQLTIQFTHMAQSKPDTDHTTDSETHTKAWSCQTQTVQLTVRPHNTRHGQPCTVQPIVRTTLTMPGKLQQTLYT